MWRRESILRRWRQLRVPTLWWAMGLAAGCTGEPELNPADVRALEGVERRFGARVEMELENELYVRARVRPNVALSDAAMDSVYRAFFFDSAGGVREDSRYIYLNVYRSDGEFLIQLSQSRLRNSIIRNRAEYY